MADGLQHFLKPLIFIDNFTGHVIIKTDFILNVTELMVRADFTLP